MSQALASLTVGSRTWEAHMISKGDTRDVPEHHWAEVAAPCRNFNVAWKAGAKASLMRGGTVEALGHDARFGLLCRYTRPHGSDEAAGAECPDGALLWIAPHVFGSWPMGGTEAEAMRHEAQERSDAVKAILGDGRDA